MKVYFYCIYENDVPIYIGMTTRSIDARHKEHIKDKGIENTDVKLIRSIEYFDTDSEKSANWNMNQFANLINREEAKLIKEYNTIDSPYQKQKDGGTVLTWFKFKTKTAYVNDIVAYKKNKRILKNFAFSIDNPKRKILKNVASCIDNPKKRILIDFVHHIDNPKRKVLKTFAYHIDNPKRKILKHVAHHIDNPKRKVLKNFAKCIDNPKRRILKNFATCIDNPKRKILKSFAGCIDNPKRKILKTFAYNIDNPKRIILKNFARNIKIN